VAEMRAAAHIAKEDDAEICSSADWRSQVAAIEVLMATRFKNHGAPVMICVLLQPGATFHNGLAGDFREPLRYKPERLTARMQFDSVQ